MLPIYILTIIVESVWIIQGNVLKWLYCWFALVPVCCNLSSKWVWGGACTLCLMGHSRDGRSMSHAPASLWPGPVSWQLHQQHQHHFGSSPWRGNYVQPTQVLWRLTIYILTHYGILSFCKPLPFECWTAALVYWCCNHCCGREVLKVTHTTADALEYLKLEGSYINHRWNIVVRCVYK